MSNETQVATDYTDETWNLIEAILPHAPRVLLHGRPATGKTTTAIELARRLDMPVHVLSCTADSPAFEARGQYVLRDGSMTWQDGPVVAARRAGGLLVIDEIARASGDMLSFLFAATATGTAARLTLPTGETLEDVASFRVVATMNGDPSELLDEALLSRFAVRIAVETTHPAAVATLPVDLQAHAVATVNLDGERRVDIRSWRAFAHLRDHVGEEHAAAACWGPRAGVILDTLRMARAAD